MLNERFYWVRIIKKYNKNFLEYQTLWKKILEKTPVDIIWQLADAVQTFFTERTSRRDKQWTPFHIIAEVGLLELYKYAFEKTGEVNPKDISGFTPLHFACQEGHFYICEFILRMINDKNPADNDGLTPLHSAALN